MTISEAEQIQGWAAGVAVLGKAWLVLEEQWGWDMWQLSFRAAACSGR